MALNRQLILLPALAFLALFLTTCETDIEVLDEDANHRTVIYGLLEADQTRHFLRINKTFRGEQAAAVLAATEGINEYEEGEITTATVYELVDQNSPLDVARRAFAIRDTVITTKQEGAFFNENSKVYYFDAELSPEYYYQIVLNVQKEDGTIQEVSATTPVIQSEAIRLQRPANGDNVCDREANRGNGEARFVSNTDYLERYEVIWGAAEFGVLYTSRMIFYYTDVYLDGRVDRDSIVISLGSVTVSPNNESPVKFIFNTTDFFSTIAARVPDFDQSQLCYREANDTLQFELEIAGEELATYREVNSPQTGVIQERPTYTNVVNGEGIWSSRITTSTRNICPFKGEGSGILLGSPSMDELLNSSLVNSGQYTVSKGFCADFQGASPRDLCPGNCP